MLKIGQPIMKKGTKRWFEIVGYNPQVKSYVARCVQSGVLEQVGYNNVVYMETVNLDLTDLGQEKLKRIYDLADQMGVTTETWLSVMIPEILADLTARVESDILNVNE